MTKSNKAWMAAVAAALLLGMLAGVVWARPNDSPAAATTRKLTLTGADFTPVDESFPWWNAGDDVSCDAGCCYFVAPVVFPTLSAVTVERIRLHAADSNGGAAVTASLRRTNPATGATANLASVTSGDTGGAIQTFSSGAINKTVTTSQRAYIWLAIGDKNIVIHGVTAEYHVNS